MMQNKRIYPCFLICSYLKTQKPLLKSTFLLQNCFWKWNFVAKNLLIIWILDGMQLELFLTKIKAAVYLENKR